ncbi:MAG: helix-turn-helix transcriptional regulator [Deltaproteobacteria bacterium]|nr:helix-turn-helix transcriptional regulator [Deltaproteobacteria bacterium]
MADEKARQRTGAHALEAGLEIYEYPVPGSDLTFIVCPADQGSLFDSLTSAELDVLDRLIEGLSNAEIARKRGVSNRTIANQLASIYKKLGVGSRSEVAALISFAPAHGAAVPALDSNRSSLEPAGKLRRTNGRSTTK